MIKISKVFDKYIGLSETILLYQKLAATLIANLKLCFRFSTINFGHLHG